MPISFVFMFKVFDFIQNFSFCLDVATFINLIFVFESCLALNLLLNPQNRNPRAGSIFIKALDRLSAKHTECLAKTK